MGLHVPHGADDDGTGERPAVMAPYFQGALNVIWVGAPCLHRADDDGTGKFRGISKVVSGVQNLDTQVRGLQ